MHDVVHGHDAGVLQGGGGLRLVEEPVATLRVGRRVRRQGLEGDEAAEQGVAGLVDDTHAALPELLDDAVAVDRLADHGGHPE